MAACERSGMSDTEPLSNCVSVAVPVTAPQHQRMTEREANPPSLIVCLLEQH